MSHDGLLISTSDENRIDSKYPSVRTRMHMKDALRFPIKYDLLDFWYIVI